jgi:integrase
MESVSTQKYKPRRDIPLAVRELKSLSPSKIREWIRDNRIRKDKLGKRQQLEITSQAINMWFLRNPKIRQELEAEIQQEELSQTAISETIFENGAFRQITSIKTWILELVGREAKEDSINHFVGDIKRICKGEIRKRGVKGKPRQEDYEIIEGWGLKHPDRLTLEDGLTYLSELKKRGHKTRQYRISLRNFFESKGIKGCHKISGATEQPKYAYLYAPKDKIYKIFDYIKRLNYEVYLASKFAFKCGGTRLSATLNAEASKVVVTEEEVTIWVLEKATKGKPKREQEKLIPQDLWEELKPRYERGGELFDIEPRELNKILKTAYKEIIPELVKEIEKPFHFWRHQFAQHMLRATGWNYGLVARLGHWTVGTLERYYGKMDRQTAFKEAENFLPFI